MVAGADFGHAAAAWRAAAAVNDRGCSFHLHLVLNRSSVHFWHPAILAKKLPRRCTASVPVNEQRDYDSIARFWECPVARRDQTVASRQHAIANCMWNSPRMLMALTITEQ